MKATRRQCRRKLGPVGALARLDLYVFCNERMPTRRSVCLYRRALRLQS